jgi:2-keto-3-deoxy-L-rhamnonate aldolase RhmA
MIASVNDEAEARAAVAACHYAPRGNRGMAATIVRASGFGMDWQGYVRRIEEDVVVMCQIETGRAVENAEKIAAVDGVDLLFIGPFDLSASMGFLGQPDHPEVRSAIGRIEVAAKATGTLIGGISTPERSAEELLADGYDLILPDCDVALLGAAARASVARLKAAVTRA